jgi:hypothetical protein
MITDKQRRKIVKLKNNNQIIGLLRKYVLKMPESSITLMKQPKIIKGRTESINSLFIFILSFPVMYLVREKRPKKSIE